MHQHTANELFNLFLFTCALRFAVSTTLRNGSDLHYNVSVMLCWSCSSWQHHFVPTTTVKMSQPETADARPWRRVRWMIWLLRCKYHDRHRRGAARKLTSPPQSCHDKCPATGEAQPHQQRSVSRRPMPTNNSGGLARIFQSPQGLKGCCTARYLVAPLSRNRNVPSIDKAAWFPHLSRPLQKRAKRH